MLNRLTLVLLTTIVTFAGTAANLAAEEPLPTAEYLLEKYIEVTGGRAAWEEIHSHVTEAAFAAPGTGMVGRRIEYAAVPNKRHVIIDVEHLGRTEEGTDGWVAWSRNPLEPGPRVFRGTAEAEAIRRATFNADLYWRDLYTEVECVGVETIENKDCYKVIKTPAVGLPETAYFDIKSNLLVKVVTKVRSNERDVSTEVFYDDYKYVGDLFIPHTILYKFQGNRQKLTLETVLHNVPLPDERFAPPQDVLQLIEERQKAQTQPAGPKTVSVPIRKDTPEKNPAPN